MAKIWSTNVEQTNTLSMQRHKSVFDFASALPSKLSVAVKA